MLRLYGTVTSPYVRRVRIVAHELGLACELVDTAAEPGQATMRAVNPLWKVPTAELEGQAIFDSRVINQVLLRRHGPGPLAAVEVDDIATDNLVTVIDGALDALINAFYLSKDGVGRETASYIQKQHQRADAAMQWIADRVDDVWLTPAKQFGLAEIALCTSVEWMRFRQTYPVERHPAIVGLVERHASRPSLAETRPPS
ncbi:glutathione S-transferase family protein [Enhygromyxa salina]|uniref:Putative GST-like protein YibF n=1 Tax=Enhygromyxa salina TaxID=215803 RepID=A0A2S9YVQ1_9BACT|nr:glutathione S-transferase N-terminal domain-containing protein [Enhygromyxa salina]PRQ09163.1 putative GST-like protein YibF [Enhygromyxa salina]